MATLVRIGELSKKVNLHINTLRRLADNGDIPVERTSGGQRLFDLDAVLDALEIRSKTRHRYRRASSSVDGSASWQREFPLRNLQEHEVWNELKTELKLDLACGAADIFPYAFMEMLNNAIDHSGGTTAKIRFWEDSENWAFEIIDDGVGVFKRIEIEFNLNAPIDALGELSKGKRTTAAKGHSGEGIFFTSKSVDLFELASNGIQWTVDNLVEDFTVLYENPSRGTRVYCKIGVKTERRLEDIFKQFSVDHDFVRTRPLVKLFEFGTRFVSRSEAKRILTGLEKFEEIDLDFEKVESVGQGFVDEIFRVWIMNHPEKKIIPVRMSPSVKFMVDRGKSRTPDQ